MKRVVIAPNGEKIDLVSFGLRHRNLLNSAKLSSTTLDGVLDMGTKLILKA